MKPHTRALFLNVFNSLTVVAHFLHRKSPLLVPAAVEEGENAEKERKRATAANSDSAEPYYDMQANSSVPDHTWKKA